MKKLIFIASFFIMMPFMAFAQMSKADRLNSCQMLSEMTQATATFRDAGLTASDAYTQMVVNGLAEPVALAVIKIVYFQAQDQSPNTIKDMTYVACIDAMSN